MTEFKQIVGRGTRVHEDTKKYYFTLIDFRKATNHFADPNFDGEPVQIYEPGEHDPVAPPDDVLPPADAEDPIPPKPGEDERVVDDPSKPDITISPGGTQPRKYYIHGDEVSVIADTKQLVKMKRGGTASEAIARMAARKWTLPEGYGFDRNEANSR